MDLKKIFLLLLIFPVMHAAANDEIVLLKEFKSVYEFSLNRKTGEPSVLENMNMWFEAIRSKSEVIIPSFYDESSLLSNAELLNNKNSRSQFNAVCGDYEDLEVFYSDVKLCSYKFIISGKGETARFSLKKEYKNARYFTSVYFPTQYNVHKRIVEFHIPDWLHLELKEFNFDGYNIKRTEFLDPKKKGKIIRYTIDTLSSYETVPLQPGKSYTYPHVLAVIKSYKNKGKTQAFMSSTSDLYKWYKTLVTEVKEDRTILSPKVSEILAGKISNFDKIKTIFYWVQDNIRYIAFEDGIAGFKPEACQKVYMNKYSDCKGMANLTKQMLLEAGFDARLAWLGTNSLVYTYDVPSLAVDNHMVCVVLLDGKYLVLDATEKFIGVNDYAERIQGKGLMIEDSNGYLFHQVPVFPSLRNKRTKEYFFNIEQNALKGKGIIKLEGEPRTAILQACNNVRNEATESLIKRSVIATMKNIQVDSLFYSSLYDREKPFTVEFKLQVDNNVMANNDELYVQPDFTPEYIELETTQDRISDLDFKEKINQHSEVKIQVPDGYMLSYLPQEMKIETYEFSFLYTYKIDENIITFSKSIIIANGKIRKASFQQWNEAIKVLRRQHKEQIVLKRI